MLSNLKDKASQVAQQVLKKAEKSLLTKFSKETKNSDGYLKVLITGAPESMSKRLVKGFADAAESYWGNLPGKNPKIINDLKAALVNEPSTSDVIELVKTLQIQLEKKQCKGILIIIDELGKFL